MSCSSRLLKLRGHLAAIFCLLTVNALTALAASAQTAPAPEAAKSDPQSPIVLSPFEVNTEQDKGFVASSSLAGGRLAGQLADTPVAYSVLTRDFIDALQLTSLSEMVKWAPNSYDLADNNQTYDTGGSVRIASRGVASNNPQRNFFPVYYDFDSYNLDRLDLARGPNAILFGTSGVGGTANSVTKTARTDRRFTTMQFSYGPTDSERFTLDHNQPLGPTVALRLNALWNDRKGWRDGDVEKRKGGTLAATWKVFRNTEIRAEAERGQSAKAVTTTNFDDNISGWDGKSTYSAIIAAANNAAGIARQGSRQAIFTPSNPEGTLLNYEGWAITQGGNATAAVPAGGTIVVGTTANITNNSINSQLSLPGNLYDLAINGSKFRLPDRKASTFASQPNFIVDNYNYTLAVTQRLGENFFAELAGNYSKETTAGDIGISRSYTKVYIDVNSLLPDGRSNPNYLQPFAQGQSYPYFQTRKGRNLRASLGYLANGTRWGDFGFNTIAGITDTTFDRNAFRYNLKTNPDPRQWPSFSPILFRYYLNTDSQRPMPQPSSWTYIDPISKTTTTVPAGLVRDYTNTSFNQLNETDYKYIQAAGSAKLLNKHLDLLAAVRRDSYTTHQDSIVLQFDNPTTWNGVTRNIKPAAPSDWASLTYRARDANGNPVGAEVPAGTRPRLSTGERDPLYVNDRFQDDYSPPDTSDNVVTYTTGSVVHITKMVSVFANYAESFAPPSVALTIDGSIFKPVAADGWDAGLRLSFLNGAVVVNATRYEGNESNRSISSTPFSTNFNAIIQANALNDLTSGGLNSRGLRSLPLGYVDSAAVKTSGYELEITANLTANWRLLLNAARPRAYQTDPNKESIAYLQKNKETLRQIVIDAGGSFVGDLATFTATIPPGQSPTEGPNAVTAWNGNMAALASLASGQKLNRLTELTGNLYTDYRIGTGKLKGLRVGVGANYRGKQVIGTKGADTIRDPANPTSAIDDPRVGPLDYVYAKAYTTAVVSFNYTFRLTKDSNVGLDFKIDNLFDYDQPLYVNTVLRPVNGDLTNPGRVSTGNRFSWVVPRNYTLSASLKF
jgi:outer membrane receptor protein involved in Fe transport